MPVESASSSASSRKRMGDPHLARYGGRLLGGAAENSSSDPVDALPMPLPTTAEEHLVKVSTTIEGMLDGCQYLPVFFLLKDEFHLSPVDISLTFGVTMVPWMLKPLLAFLSDRVPIFGRHRTPYMGAAVVIISGGFVGANLATTYMGTMASLSCITIGRSLLGAVSQAMLVEVGRPRGHSGITSLVGDFFLYRTGGSFLASMGATFVVSHYSPRKAFKLALVLPACLLLALARYETTRVVDTVEVQPAVGEFNYSGLADLQAMVRQPVVWGPLAFLFIYNAGPNYDDPLYVYFLNQLHFEPYMVGQLVVMHSLAKMIGVFLYRYALRGIDDRKLIVGLTALSCPLMLSPLLVTTGLYQTMHINPRLLALSGELIREVFIHLQMMPAMARWIQLAPKGSEGTVLSLLVATTHISRAVSKGTSAAAAYGLGITSTNFDNISVLVAISGFSVLLPIAFVSDLIPKELPKLTSGSEREDSASGPVAQSEERPPLLDLSYELRGDARDPIIVPAG